MKTDSHYIFENVSRTVGKIQLTDHEGQATITVQDHSISNIAPTVEQAIIDEPMIYGGSLNWCKENAGPITKSLISKLSGDDDISHQKFVDMACAGYHPVVDTKSVLLMPGQYACVPGWHCDGVIRSARGEQPDMSTLREPVMHYVCAISSVGETVTEYMKDVFCCPFAPEGTPVWQHVDRMVSNTLDSYSEPQSEIYTAQSGEIMYMERSCLHRCPPVMARQWRYLFRLSFYHMPTLNQFRKQVNVYTDINKGW